MSRGACVMFLAGLAMGSGCSALGGRCEPQSCQVAGAQCGLVEDGCGGTVECGACGGTAVCGAVTANQCCTPKACQAGVDCHLADDGCGGTVECGECTDPTHTCGGSGTANVCGCAPRNDCGAVGFVCGDLPDSCGGTVSCGMCNAPDTCGGGGTQGQCGCTPFASCAAAGAVCGMVSDGCGGTLTCTGTCTSPQTCGGGGTPGQCGCTPVTCQGTGVECGSLPDGCGGTVECGECLLPQMCGGGGQDYVCGCTPAVCPANLRCGTIPDGCGGQAVCGGGAPCGAGTECGGGGADNVCAAIAPFLVYVHPRVLSPGATLYLEGSFDTGITVNFFGGATAVATRTGLRRAEATVPQTALSGPLSVTSGGVTTAALPVEIALSTLGLQPFGSLQPQTGAAAQALRLITPRDHHQSVRVGNALYVLGGRSASGVLASIERAPVQDDGTVGAPADAGVSLTTPRERFGAIVANGAVWVVGGVNVGGHQRSVERAPILADGSLGAFATVAGVELGAGRRDFGLELLGNYVHILGGAGGSGAVATSERAQFLADGTLTSFSVTGNVLLTPRTTHATVVAGNSLYVLGGLDNMGNTLGSIERAPIHADGSLGAFVAETTTLVTPRFDLATAVVGNTLYAVGGRGGGLALASVESAPLGLDGVLGAFAAVTGVDLQHPRHGHGVLAIQNMLVAVGGKDANGQIPEVETASLVATGDVQAYQDLPAAALTTARSRHNTVVLGNHLYVLGGVDAAGNTLSSVEAAVLAPDGLPGAFANAGVTLTTPRQGAAALHAGGRLYLVGGENGATALSSLEYAPVAPDGTLGAFVTLPNVTLLSPRSDFAAAVTARGLFVLGGRNGQTTLSSVERSPINAVGALGPFENVAQTVLATPRAYAGSFVAGSFLYLVGGMDAQGTVLANVDRSLLTNGDPGAFESSGSLLGTPRASALLHRTGTYIYVVGGTNGTTALSTVERAGVLATGGVGAMLPYTTTLAAAREAGGAVVLNSSVLVVGGSNAVALASVERARIP